MYRHRAGDPYPLNNSDMERIPPDDGLEQGVGYWLITDHDVVLKMNTSLSSQLQQTPMSPSSDYSGVESSYFNEVFHHSLPDSQTDIETKVMVGNPFVRGFNLANMYYSHNGAKYSGMNNVDENEVRSSVYAHDDSDKKSDGYIAIVPGTPGFNDDISTMLGYWIIMKEGNTDGNEITYPFEKK
ncbi:Calcium-binding protein [hydrothermal vent metagenome]|uniref:Calcium-binding protein n=1 Tax=hydrothermal vent metagenome TaxID=652676 RepID=A0A1W1CXR7_9ZZZZ